MYVSTNSKQNLFLFLEPFLVIVLKKIILDGVVSAGPIFKRDSKNGCFPNFIPVEVFLWRTQVKLEEGVPKYKDRVVLTYITVYLWQDRIGFYSVFKYICFKPVLIYTTLTRR